MMSTTRRSPRVLAILIALIALSSFWTRPNVRAQEVPAAPGGFLELATSTDTRPLISASELAALLPIRGTFTFPAPYGTTGVRLTNADDCSGFGDCVQTVGDPTWSHVSNSKGSNLLYVVVGLSRTQGGTGATVFQYNKSTGDVVNLGGLFDINDDLTLNDVSTWYFSSTHPTMFYVSIDQQLRRYDVVTHAASTVFDITDIYGDDKEIADVHSSADDRVHSFTVRLTTNGIPTGCGIYREDTAQFTLIPPQGTLLDCRVDRSGQWVLIKENDDNRIVNLALGTETTLVDADGAAGADDMGFGGMIAADDHNLLPNAIRPWTFGPLTSGPVVYHDLPGQPESFTSISFANARSAALDEQYACGSAVNRTNGPRANEIVCVKLDGSLSTLVVAPVMTDMDAAGGGVNESAKWPNGQLDPTGEYFLWTSNAMGGRVDAFLVRVPFQNLVTPPSDTTAPTVSIAAPGQLATVGGNAVPLTATAADNVGVAGVQFTLDGVNLGSEITTAPFAWSWNTNTISDGVHVLTAVARDAAGNTTVSVPVSVTVQNTPAAPVISGVTSFGIKQFRAFVSWTTNQLADGFVEYGPTTAYGFSTPLNAGLSTNHLQMLTDLAAGTTYHYRITSKNAQGAATTTGDFTFTTAAALAITNVASSLTSSSVVITWATNLAASSQVEYGLTTDYGDATDFHESLVAVHNEPLPPLLPDTTYHYRVYSVSAAGTLVASDDFTFHTLPAAGGAPGGILETAISLETRPLPSAASLAALIPERGAFTLPAPYGTSAVRITNGSDCSTADCVRAPGAAHWRNMSNSAGSDLMYIVLGLDRIHGGSGASVFRYNKATQEIVNLGPLFDAGDDLTYSDAGGWYFSATMPTAYYVSVDRQLRRYDVVTRAFTTVFDITPQFGADKEILSAHSSRNDLVHSFTLRYTGTGVPIGCGVYREDLQRFSLYPAQGTFHECQVDQTGLYLLMKEDQDGLGGEDNRIIDLTTGNATSLLDAQGAGGASDLGFGMMLAADDHDVFPNAIRPWNFGPLLAAPVVYHDLAGQPSTFTTISFANARSASLDQQFACGSAVNRTNGPRANEIVCVRLDGSLSTLVVAPVMTDLDAPGGGDDDAAKAPNGNLDPTGEYFLWTSNAMGNRLDAFLVRVPSQILVTPPADTTAPTVSITAPAGSGTVSGSAVAVTASAADDNLAGVQFKLDGVNLGAEVTTAPFTTTWNSTVTSDGVHVLTAVARDNDGNTAIAWPVPVTVLNNVGAPQITGVNASMVSTTTALVGWSTNQLADTQIEYGLTTAYGSSTSLDTLLASSHSQFLSGLTANTTYHYRVLSRNAQNALAASGDFTFTTSAAVAISGVGLTAPAGFSATIGWTTNLAASSQVEYGLTTNYGDATEVNAAFTTSHAETIGGLALGTTYHYRVYSVAANGTQSVSGDLTFTTSTYPVISGVGTSGLTPTAATVGWTTDELTSSTVEYGLTTAYGSTAGDLTGVTAHSVPLSGLTAGTTYHFRVSSTIGGLTTMSDDFTFTTVGPPVVSDVTYVVANANVTWTTDQPATSRVEFGLTTDYGSQTILDNTLVTSHAQFLDGLASGTLYHYRVISTNTFGLTTTTADGTFTTGVKANITALAATSITGTTATIIWQTDQPATTLVEYGLTTNYGTSTTLDPTLVTSHSQLLSGLTPGQDYFYRVRSTNAAGLTSTVSGFSFSLMPTMSAVTTSNITDTSATIAWTTNMPADTVVEYGLTTAYGTTSSDPTLGTSHTRVLTGLTAGATYHFRARSTNDGAITVTTTDMTFTTITAPLITGVTYVKASAQVTWTTDQDTNATVEWGLTAAYTHSTTDSSLGTGHALQLFALDPGTTYHYRVSSTNAVGLTTTTADATFTTGVKPVISGIAVTFVGPTSTTIEWTTDKQTTSVIEYGPTTDYGFTNSNGSLIWLHSQTLTGLTESTTYHFRIVASDVDGVTATSPDQTVTTLGAPIVSGIQYLVPTAQMMFTTDQHAASQVEWGLTTAYGLSTSFDPNGYTKNHLWSLFGLDPGTTYHFRIKAVGTSGLTTFTPDMTFTTGVRPTISNVSASNVTKNSATINWTTDQLTDSRVEYGLTTNYGSSTTLDPTMVTSHSQTLTGLQANKTYHYRVISTNADGLDRVSADFTFTTLPFSPEPEPETSAPMEVTDQPAAEASERPEVVKEDRD